jgi:hypothetical protein
MHAVALAGLTLGIAACASAPAPRDTGATGAPAAQANARPNRRQSNVITAAEIAEARASNAYHAVEMLRPTFLRASNPRFPVVVFVNGNRRGGVEELRNLRAEEIETITRMNAADAQMRYGPDLLSGVLDVVTKPGRG